MDIYIYLMKLFAHIHISFYKNVKLKTEIYLFIYIHMLAIAGQTGGPNWMTMTCFLKTHVEAEQIRIFFFKKRFF